MAVNDDIYGNLNIGDLPLELIDFEDILKEESRKNTDSLSKLCSQLCVPPDPIEDLEWFPSFFDDLIALDLKDLGLVPIDPAHDKQFYNFPITLEGQEDFKSTNDVKLVADAPSCGKQSYIDYFPVTPQLREKKSKNIDKDVIEHGLLGFTWKKRARAKNYYKRRENVTWMKKKCSHCETDETPQWRNGPKGPKTLCNACGVRFKSGRLVPEYRPALSPTFDSTKHSNFHKRILRKLFLCWK